MLYIDEENPSRVVRARLGALGMTNDLRDRLRYYRRNGVRIGDDAWQRWLTRECASFAPDVVIVDTVMAAGGVDVNDNDAVVRFYVKVLRPLAEAHGLAVVILHHERKPGAQEKRNAGFAMMGARQWAGQADVHMTLTAVSDYTETPRDAGGVDTHKEFRFSVEKGRDGHSSRPERTVVRGDKDARYRLTSMEVEWLGRIEDGAEEIVRESILRALAAAPDRKLERKAAAAACGQSNPSVPDGTFTRAWKTVKDDGYAEAAGNGIRLTDKGTDKADALGLEV